MRPQGITRDEARGPKFPARKRNCNSVVTNQLDQPVSHPATSTYAPATPASCRSSLIANVGLPATGHENAPPRRRNRPRRPSGLRPSPRRSARRPLPPHPKLNNTLVDFGTLPAEALWWTVDGVICNLGTTIKKSAGSFKTKHWPRNSPSGLAPCDGAASPPPAHA